MRGSGIFAQELVLNMSCDAEILTGDDYEECGFEGDVDVSIDDFRVGAWECPWCHTQHEVEPHE